MIKLIKLRNCWSPNLDNLAVSSPVFWIMGPTSSGKTTLAVEIVKRLTMSGSAVLWYDGDEVRDLMGANYGFKPEDRLLIVSTLIYLAKKAQNAGIPVFVSALTANQDARDLIKSSLSNNIILVSVECSVDECIKRDPKGLYKKAINGEIETLIGYNTPYNPPNFPDIVVKTEGASIKEAVDNFFRECERLGIRLERDFYNA